MKKVSFKAMTLKFKPMAQAYWCGGDSQYFGWQIKDAYSDEIYSEPNMTFSRYDAWRSAYLQFVGTGLTKPRYKYINIYPMGYCMMFDTAEEADRWNYNNPSHTAHRISRKRIHLTEDLWDK